jgi:hypothetical protein
MSAKDRPNILFLNVGWMKRYNGPAADDPTRGNFGWLNSDGGHRHGHECYNFTNDGGFCFGSHPGSVGTEIQRLGAGVRDAKVDGVVVVWFSRNPRTGNAVIIGWYENATVYRKFQEPKPGDRRMVKGQIVQHKVEARYSDCRLLKDSDSERYFQIPNRFERQGGYGQSPNWYGVGERFLDEVWGFIQGWKATPETTIATKPPLPPRTNDPDLKLLVEGAAIRVAKEFYRSPAGGSREVRSVEKENLGWDLEAKGPNDTLKVEVKGVSASAVIAELTPNEFSKMKAHRSSWALFIVTGCLSETPKPFEFRYMHDAKRWETTYGGVLNVQERVAAVVNLLPARPSKTP